MGAREFCHLQRSFRKGMQAVVRDILLGPTTEEPMGFMDKAKKLAEQAQEKLDEAQKNFNQGEGGSGSQPAQDGVRYDEHGRPIQPETPAAATPPPAASPAPPAPDPATPAPDPTAPVEGAAQEPSEAPRSPEAPPPSDPPSGDANASPDPFKPLQQ
jgi:hypothetical protein